MSRLLELAEKEILRQDMLEICRQSIPLGADEKVLRAALRKNGYDVTEQQVTEQLYYLRGKGLVELQTAENRALGIRRTIARITPEGMDVMDGSRDAEGLGTGG